MIWLLSQSSCVSPVVLTGRGGGRGGSQTKSYEGGKARSSIQYIIQYSLARTQLLRVNHPLVLYGPAAKIQILP
jgi:hypothetical protein